MRHYTKITVGCLVAALTAGPAFAQSTTPPGAGPTPSNTPGMSPSTTPGKAPTATPDKGQSMQKSDTQKSDSQGVRSQDAGMTHGKGAHKASNSQVRQVQEALKSQGHDPGPIDGVMGPQTQKAMKEYQRSQNLSETGRLDAQTAEKLGVK